MALRRRWFSVSSSFMRLTWLDLSPPYSWRQRSYVTSVTPIARIASATGVPCATSTSTWRSLATISSGLCLFLDMDPSSFGSEAILQGGPLQRGRIRPRSGWERPHDGGSASSDPASSREPEGVGPAPRDQPEDGRQVEEAPLGPGRTHRPEGAALHGALERGRGHRGCLSAAHVAAAR